MTISFSTGPIPVNIRQTTDAVAGFTGIDPMVTIAEIGGDVDYPCYLTSFATGGLWSYARALTPTTEVTLTDGGIFKFTDTDPVMVLEAHAQFDTLGTYSIVLCVDGDSGDRDVNIVTSVDGDATRRCFANPIIVMPYQFLRVTSNAAGTLTFVVARAQATHIC